jgi:hypothetical protein
MKFKPPRKVIENARKALKCREDYNINAGTRVGWIRANQLAKGKEVSLDIVKRIAKFERHRKNAEYKGNPCLDKGKVMWDA